MSIGFIGLKYYPGISLEGLMKTVKDLNQYSWFLG
jgi:hypothetical protein